MPESQRFLKANPILWIVGILLVVFWVGSWTVPQLFSRVPTATANLTPTTLALPTEIIDDKGVTMQLVPAGDFTMGSDSDDDIRNSSHNLYLDAFYMDKYEVTNAHYADCVTAGVCDPPHETKSDYRDSYYGNSEYDNFPVIYVDWYMAKTYCEWRGAHLPTEAEWEKAARGTDVRTPGARGSVATKPIMMATPTMICIAWAKRLKLVVMKADKVPTVCTIWQATFLNGRVV